MKTASRSRLHTIMRVTRAPRRRRNLCNQTMVGSISEKSLVPNSNRLALTKTQMH